MIIFMSLGLLLGILAIIGFITGATIIVAGTFVISIVLTFVLVLVFFKVSNFIVEKIKSTAVGKNMAKQVKKVSEFDSENAIKIIAIICLIVITLIVILGA